jgi:hypothetical protein
MLDKIKKALYAMYSPDEVKGIFFSGFGENQQLVFSQWVVTTDKPIHELVESLYGKFSADQLKKVRYMAVDIVSDITEVHDLNEAMQVPTDEFGFAVISTDTAQSGVILPKTAGVSDAKSALFDLKQKYDIHGKAEVFLFRTQRITIAK